MIELMRFNKSEFRELVFDAVSRVPKGKVATYGQIAAMVFSASYARQVGFALRTLTVDERNIPWWRIINSKGYLSINHGTGLPEKIEQKGLLEREDVIVGDDFTVDLGKYLWKS